MNILRTSRAVFGIIVSLSFLLYSPVAAKGPLVSEFGTTNENSNKHNLSAVGRIIGTTNLAGYANPNTYKATNDPTGNPKGRQVCIFCHTPHNSNTTQQAPLWNRRLSSTIFSRYSSGTLQIRINAAARTPANYNVGAQPDGVSKLCLSCHDGTIGLGDVISGGPITMAGADKITGRALFNNNKMKLGHHPVSFVYNASVRDAIKASGPQKSLYALPSLPQVKLDKNGKMQCTTCHNPHQNQTDDAKCYLSGVGVGACAPAPDNRKVAPFWVYGAAGVATTDHDDVCKTCHPMDAGTNPPNYGTPWPWP